MPFSYIPSLLNHAYQRLLPALPALLPHPPNLITLRNEPLLKQRSPPLHAQQLLPLAPSNMKPLCGLVHANAVVRAFLLEHAEGAADVGHDPHSAAQRRLQPQLRVLVWVGCGLLQVREQ